MADLSFTQNDLIIRLGVALACSAALGINRDLHHKPAGLRTFALVSLASATVAVLVVNSGSSDFAAVSRVMQGILTGVGFLGAGVILHPEARRVAGLTTAASVLASRATRVRPVPVIRSKGSRALPVNRTHARPL